jgi:hypothetical protein
MLKIDFPFHGAVLNHRHGMQTEAGLIIEVSGSAPLDTPVSVNGRPARRKFEHFYAPVELTKFSNEICVSCQGVRGESQHNIKVVWDKHSRKRYRVSIDDNIFFLRDLYQKKPKDILSNHYLAILKRLHDQFGSKFTCNLFYKTPEDDFNLSQMPDTWKSQFQEQSDWLRFTWHAYGEFPDRPYQFAEADKVVADLTLIKEQVERFAGPESYCPPTIVHWGGLTASALPALYQQGVRVLSGYFIRPEQNYDISTGLDDVRANYLSGHDALMDFDSGIVFSHTDIVINNTPVEEIVPKLAEYVVDRDNAEIMDLLTHEQYFWPFYFNYVPDHEQRMATAFQYMAEHDYQPVWFHEGLMGVPKA